MKFSYSRKLGKYVASELGKLIDSDDEFDALLTRHGIPTDDTDDAIAAAEAMADTLLELTPTDDEEEDPLEIIREFLGD